MERRDFLKQTSTLTIGITGLYGAISLPAILKWYDDNGVKAGDVAVVSRKLETDFVALLEWLNANGWGSYLNKTLGVNLSLRGDELAKELVRKLDAGKLATLRQAANSGYDDFAGEQLIQPGFPAYSLLYHTLASPRVRPEGVKEYPSLRQIDLLENYIYALCDWAQLKGIYGIAGNEELILAVFAYEYRPAFKTPHHAYADMVYSRTGIARIGDEPYNYDTINRCHTNRPANISREKQVAVVPARYGLYIARKVQYDEIALVKNEVHKGNDSKDDRNDDCKVFLQPIRKLFNNDMLTDSAIIVYEEQHKSEKLQKLAQSKGINILHGLRPMPRYSKDLIVQDDTARHAGSSFLIISQHASLIRQAREGGHPLFFKVPPELKEPYENRYFTALCTQEVENVELLDGNGDSIARVYNQYQAPRNQPLFVNITNEAVDDTGYRVIAKTPNDSFEHKVEQGLYFAPLFEDSICDGMVTARIDKYSLGKLKGISPECLPAFSIVTAPDFFPQVDPMDFEACDVAPGLSKESNFYEGGVASLATARIKPNPKMINTDADNTSDTYLAVLSGMRDKQKGAKQEQERVYKNPASDRGYEISGFLPDVASSVFAPGWDVTYCSLDNAHDIYIGTEGLGSPFIEDMKFCSALNGMWPATSPDASRTYQGSNESNYRNPTAVPLLDKEIGICADGPAGKAHECSGWDGEQGPFLEKTDTKQWKINFTDLGRADAVSNALAGKLDMSQLRKLKSGELIARMDCLKLCIQELPQKNFHDEVYKSKIAGYTYLWLVSAEKVNWGKEDAAALGIPTDLAGTDKKWITDKANAIVSGEGYLYVFANSAVDGLDENEQHNEPAPIKPKEWTKDLKRRRLDCKQIYVCQVTCNATSPHKIAWAEVGNGDGDAVKWNIK